MEFPETRYVAVEEADVAYQVFGNGPRDLLFCNALGGQVDQIWQLPAAERFLRELATFTRFIHFDRRGTGASDPLSLNAIPTWERLAEDMTAILDVVGSEHADVLAVSEVGPMAILFAAVHPEKVGSLILVNTSARYVTAEDYPIGVEPEVLDAIIDVIASSWGAVEMAAISSPQHAADPDFLAAVSRVNRASATPRSASVQMRHFLGTMDVRSLLSLVQQPTLVLQVVDSPFTHLAQGRYLAEHIPGAKLVELAGGEMYPPFGPEAIDEIREFLTGERHAITIDRVLTTIVLTDIVRSTEHVASLGDDRWQVLLDAHDRVVREQLQRFAGREIKHTGDGFLCSFDGPARAIRCVGAMLEATGTLGLELRVGIHTGECEVRGGDLAGLAVHLAARVSALAEAGEILVSSTVKDLVAGSGIAFLDRGERELRGVPGRWTLYAVEGERH